MNFTLTLALIGLTSFSAYGACFQDLCEGSDALDRSDRIVRLLEVNDQGDIKARRSNGYSYDYSYRDLSAEISGRDRFQRNVVVLDGSNRYITLKRFFKNGQVQATRSNGYSYWYNLNSDTLVFKTDQIGDLKTGTVAIDGSDRIVTVTQLLENNTLQARRSNGYTYWYDVRDLHIEVESLGRLTKGIQVVDGSNRFITLNRFFKNGRISARRENGYSYWYDSNDTLNFFVDKLGKLTKGAQAIDRSDRIVTVQEMVENGTLRARRSNGYTYWYDQTDLSIRVNTVDGFSDGTIALDRSDRIVTVKDLFENGRLKGRRSNGYTYDYSTNELSKESQTHPEYNKQNRYATNDGDLVQVKMFFEDKRVQVHSLEGYRSIENKLYSQVDSINGIEKGHTFLFVNGRKGTVEEIYENEFLRMEVTIEVDGKEEKRLLPQGVEVISISDITEDHLDEFLYVSARELDMDQDYPYLYSNDSYVLTQEDHEALMVKLKEYFLEGESNDYFTFRYGEEIVNKMRSFLGIEDAVSTTTVDTDTDTDTDSDQEEGDSQVGPVIPAGADVVFFTENNDFADEIIKGYADKGLKAFQVDQARINGHHQFSFAIRKKSCKVTMQVKTGNSTSTSSVTKSVVFGKGEKACRKALESLI